MLNLYQTKNEWDYDEFKIETSEGNFGITFAPNLDLYWYYNPKGSLLNCPDKKEFIITDENRFVCNCFNKLYKAIESSKPYLNVLLDCDCRNKVDKYALRPYENNCIKWLSDEHYKEDASSVTIKKEESTFKVIFEKSKGAEFPTFYVRFRNSGSRYNPYNITFMSLYNKFKEYNFENKKDSSKIKKLFYKKSK